MVKKFRNPIVAIFLALICLGIVMCTQALVGNRGNESSQYAPTVSWTDGTGTKDLLPSGVDSVRFTLSGNGYYNIFTWPYAAHTGTARVPKGLIFVVTVEGINKSNVVLFTGTKKDTANGDIMTDTIKATQVTPITPDSFSATPLCTTQVALKWKIMSANEDEFHILRAVAAATKFTDTIIVPANDTTYIDSACSPNTKYRYRIYAVNTAGNSDTSDSVSATTPDTDHTPIVTGLRPTPQSPYDTIKVGAKYLKKILYLDQDVGDVVTLSAAAPLSLSHDTISWIANDSTLGLKILTVYATDSFGKIDTFPINIYVADTSTGTKYSLTINGKLNGNWVAGRRVTISDSLTKADSVFDHWSGTDSNLVDTLTAASTIITMPAINVSLNSVYRYNDRPPVIDSVSSEPWLFDSIGVTVKMHLVYSDPDVGDPLTVTVDTPLVKLTKDTISWTPVSAGSKTLSVYVTDSHGKSDTLRWNASVPDSSTGTKYQLTVTGGTGTAKYASGTSVSNGVIVKPDTAVNAAVCGRRQVQAAAILNAKRRAKARGVRAVKPQRACRRVVIGVMRHQNRVGLGARGVWRGAAVQQHLNI